MIKNILILLLAGVVILSYMTNTSVKSMVNEYGSKIHLQTPVKIKG